MTTPTDTSTRSEQSDVEGGSPSGDGALSEQQVAEFLASGALEALEEQAAGGVDAKVERMHERLWRLVRNELRPSRDELRRLRYQLAVERGLRSAPVTTADAEADAEDDAADRALFMEIFPPERDNRAYGVEVARHDTDEVQTVDCASRLHVCRSACCRLFNVLLTAEEVPRYQDDWSLEHPYSLRRTQSGACASLQAGTCGCAIYDRRPESCSRYSCRNDKRIWADFDAMALQPDTLRRLDQQDGIVRPGEPEDGSAPDSAAAATSSRSTATGASTTRCVPVRSPSK